MKFVIVPLLVLIVVAVNYYILRQIFPTAKHREKMERDEIKGIEYRRTCRNCGMIWYAPAEREMELEAKAIEEVLGNTGNEFIYATEVHRLRVCPECKQANYSEKKQRSK